MMELIKSFMLHYSVHDGMYARIEADLNDIDLCFASDDCVVEKINSNLLLSSLEEILSNPKEYDIKPVDVKMFKLYYFEDKNYADIARMMGYEYATVRSKVKKLKDKISFILFNSKK